MNKTIWILSVLTMTRFLSLHAETPSYNRIILEFRPSYFYPISSDFRDIFHDGGVNYQITGSFPVYKGLSVYGAVDYFSKSSHTGTFHNKTSLRLVPLTLGLKYFFPSLGASIPVNFYLAGGMKYYFVHTHNNGTPGIVRQTVNKNGMGGTVETGFITTFVKHLVLDIFASYSFRTFGAPRPLTPAVEATGLNVSGLNIGLGLGYKF